MEDFGRQPSHGIAYDAALLDIEPRELLRLSQVEITPDRNEGLHYAAAAVDASFAVKDKDPLLYGSAAALFAFRTTLNGVGVGNISSWYRRSTDYFQTLGRAGRRESIATNILAGRSYDYMSLKPEAIKNFAHDGITTASDMRNRAHGAYTRAEHKIAQLRNSDEAKWDLYAVTLPVFQAVHESLEGNTAEACQIALRGIQRARHALREDNTLKGRIDHELFVAQQILLSGRVLRFCMATPLNRIPPVMNRRMDYARVIFSGSSDNAMLTRITR